MLRLLTQSELKQHVFSDCLENDTVNPVDSHSINCFSKAQRLIYLIKGGRISVHDR